MGPRPWLVYDGPYGAGLMAPSHVPLALSAGSSEDQTKIINPNAAKKAKNISSKIKMQKFFFSKLRFLKLKLFSPKLLGKKMFFSVSFPVSFG